MSFSMRETFVSLQLVADAGIPMIFLTFPVMLLVLIPVILIEASLCKKWLNLSTSDAIRSNAVANLASTIIGVPIAWAIMVGVEIGTIGLVSKSSAIENSKSPIAHVILFALSSAWIGPAEGKDVWIIPCAVLILLIPFFFASYGVEYLIINHMLGMPEGDPSNLTSRRIRVAVRNSNLWTYAIMAIAAGVMVIVLLLYHD
jgi:hypothetical protein